MRPLGDRLRIAGRMVPFVSVMESFSGRLNSESVQFDRTIDDFYRGTDRTRSTFNSVRRRARKRIVMFLRRITEGSTTPPSQKRNSTGESQSLRKPSSGVLRLTHRRTRSGSPSTFGPASLKNNGSSPGSSLVASFDRPQRDFVQMVKSPFGNDIFETDGSVDKGSLRSSEDAGGSGVEEEDEKSRLERKIQLTRERLKRVVLAREVISLFRGIKDTISSTTGGVFEGIRGGLTGLSAVSQNAAGSVISVPRDLASRLKNKFGSADNIPAAMLQLEQKMASEVLGGVAGPSLVHSIMLSTANILVETLKIVLFLSSVVLDTLKPFTGTRTRAAVFVSVLILVAVTTSYLDVWTLVSRILPVRRTISTDPPAATDVS
uniref:Transmembrane protein n=1 Tax=Plectus sambesii TaxID=2011161 RepID=A0A914W5C1_9BILA